jgi:hypothetical protein
MALAPVKIIAADFEAYRKSMGLPSGAKVSAADVVGWVQGGGGARAGMVPKRVALPSVLPSEVARQEAKDFLAGRYQNFLVNDGGLVPQAVLEGSMGGNAIRLPQGGATLENFVSPRESRVHPAELRRMFPPKSGTEFRMPYEPSGADTAFESILKPPANYDGSRYFMTEDRKLMLTPGAEGVSVPGYLVTRDRGKPQPALYPRVNKERTLEGLRREYSAASAESRPEIAARGKALSRDLSLYGNEYLSDGTSVLPLDTMSRRMRVQGLAGGNEIFPKMLTESKLADSPAYQNDLMLRVRGDENTQSSNKRKRDNLARQWSAAAPEYKEGIAKEWNNVNDAISFHERESYNRLLNTETNNKLADYPAYEYHVPIMQREAYGTNYPLRYQPEKAYAKPIYVGDRGPTLYHQIDATERSSPFMHDIGTSAMRVDNLYREVPQEVGRRGRQFYGAPRTWTDSTDYRDTMGAMNDRDSLSYRESQMAEIDTAARNISAGDVFKMRSGEIPIPRTTPFAGDDNLYSRSAPNELHRQSTPLGPLDASTPQTLAYNRANMEAVAARDAAMAVNPNSIGRVSEYKGKKAAMAYRPVAGFEPIDAPKEAYIGDDAFQKSFDDLGKPANKTTFQKQLEAASADYDNALDGLRGQYDFSSVKPRAFDAAAIAAGDARADAVRSSREFGRTFVGSPEELIPVENKMADALDRAIVADRGVNPPSVDPRKYGLVEVDPVAPRSETLTGIVEAKNLGEQEMKLRRMGSSGFTPTETLMEDPRVVALRQKANEIQAYNDDFAEMAARKDMMRSPDSVAPILNRLAEERDLLDEARSQRPRVVPKVATPIGVGTSLRDRAAALVRAKGMGHLMR